MSEIPERLNIGFVGAGNVATHLACALASKGHRIVSVTSKSSASAAELTKKIGTNVVNTPADMPDNLDLVIISTTDNAVDEISAVLPPLRGIVVHTSGSVPLSVLASHHKHAGVLYPLQTFSKNVPVEISEVPFFIEATDSETLQRIKLIAKELSSFVYEADSYIRRKLHVAGVLSSNFPIYLLEMSRRVLADVGLPLSIVKPLIETSISKAFTSTPMDALTGPAKRGDVEVVKQHIDSFSNSYERDIYNSISQAILSEYKK